MLTETVAITAVKKDVSNKTIRIIRNSPKLIGEFFSVLFKCIFIQITFGTQPILRYVFPRGTGSNTVFGIAAFGIINITARTDIFFHIIHLGSSIGKGRGKY